MTEANGVPANLSPLLAQVRVLIVDARQQALRAVDALQVRTYWA
jgi:hypothetical protein